MKLWILSDMHQEFSNLRWSPDRVPDHDVLVLAGDITNGVEKAIIYGLKLSEKPIVMVAGNHEHYGRNRAVESSWGQQIAAKNDRLHFLENSETVIGDVRFLGATLWTDFSLFPETVQSTMKAAGHGLNDFQIVRDTSPDGAIVSFTPEMSVALHEESKAYLASQLAMPFDGTTVVVTHHGPHPNSVAERFAMDRLTAGFVSDLSDLISEGHPDLWIHGHVHDRFDYELEGGTRVIANPRGYFAEIGSHPGRPAWNDALVIDTDELRPQDPAQDNCP